MMVQARRPDDLDEEEIASKAIGLKAINIVDEDNAILLLAFLQSF